MKRGYMAKKKKWKFRKFYLILPVLVLAAALMAAGCGSKPELSEKAEEIHKKLIGDNTLVVDSVSEDKYAYQTLNEEQKQVYDAIVYTIMNRESDVQIATTDVETMELAYQAVRYDYCGFFWVDQLNYVTYTRNNEVTAIEISPTYTMSEAEQKRTQEQIDQEADRMLAAAPVDGDDFDKALYVYETLIQEVDYVVDSENNQNIISAFLNHETICQGYAYATQYLLERLGIPCTTVTGNARGESHAWNLVLMDGAYYYIDTTWGNSQYTYQDGQGSGTGNAIGASKFLDYDYFGTTTEMLMKTHTPDPEIPLPECTATEDNYFVHEGLYVDSWDANRIGEMIRTAYDSGRATVQIKFSNVELCEQAMQYFVEDSHIFDYCAGIDSIQYLENTENAVMVLLFPTNAGK